MIESLVICAGVVIVARWVQAYEEVCQHRADEQRAIANWARGIEDEPH